MTVTALSAAGSVLIRAARRSDGAALGRLAQLDSARVPAGDLIVAETDGTLVAAHSPGARATIADPFRPTADVVHLLEVRGAMMRAA